MSVLLLLVYAILLVVILGAFRCRPGRPMRLVLWACVALTLPKVLILCHGFLLGFIRGLFRVPLETASYYLRALNFYADRISHIVFAMVMTCALVFFMKEQRTRVPSFPGK